MTMSQTSSALEHDAVATLLIIGASRGIEPGRTNMADRTDRLRAAASQCLTLAQASSDPQVRAALLIMAQRLNDMASGRHVNFEMAQREFNDRQMLPPMQRQRRIQQ
jgi:hypothetical protein